MDKTAAFAVVIGDAIRELTSVNPLKGVPSGELYAVVAPHMMYQEYVEIIESLIAANLVKSNNHLLSWIGPAAPTAEEPMSKKKPTTETTRSPRLARAPRSNTKETGPTSTQETGAAPTNSVVPEVKQNISPEGQNIALTSAQSGVSSIAAAGSPGTVNSGQPGEIRMATFKFRKTDKSGSSSYSMEGVKSSVYFNKGIFGSAPPESIDISLPEGASFTAPGSVRVTGVAAQTKEQRLANLEAARAKRAAMTPAEKAADRLAKAKAVLAAAEKAASAAGVSA